VTKEVLKANRTNPGLETEQAKAIKGTAPWELFTGLLLQYKRIVIPDGYNNL
jgi:hypothetical protein